MKEDAKRMFEELEKFLPQGHVHQVPHLEQVGFGASLPKDYLHFIAKLGPGRFVFEIFDIEIFDLTSAIGLSTVNEYLDIFQDRYSSNDYREIYSHREPVPVYPTASGLLPWGCDNEDATFFWATAGEPDMWTIAVDTKNYPTFHNCNFVQFIYEAVLGTQKFGRYLRKVDSADSVVFVPE